LGTGIGDWRLGIGLIQRIFMQNVFPGYHWFLSLWDNERGKMVDFIE